MQIELNNLALSARKKIGNRIKGARIMIGLTQEEFAAKYSISLSTLKNFEFARVIPRSKTIQSIIEAIRNEGLSIDEKWLIYGGTGKEKKEEAPNFLQPKKKTLGEVEALCGYLSNQGLDPIVAIAQNNDMAPNYLRGDVLIGSLVGRPISSLDEFGLIDKKFLIEDEDAFKPCSLVKNSKDIYAINNLNTMLIRVKEQRVAHIIWHRHFD